MNDLDNRELWDPEQDSPQWFWDLIEQGEQNPARFHTICQSLPKERLAGFIREYAGLASFFVVPPFTLHLRGIGLTGCSEDTLDAVARLVVSQGKSEVMRIWNHPEEFGALVREWLDEPSIKNASAKSYAYIAEDVWTERFGDEDIGAIPDCIE